MTPGAPKISVIVAVFNNAATVKRCIESVINQTYENKELIVMDGGSTDGTPKILGNLDAQIDIWESAPDRGIYHAWNKALAKATGDWICFVGSDDYLWRDDVLEKMTEHLPVNTPKERLVYGQVAQLNKNGDILKHKGRPWEIARREMRQYLSIPHPGLFHHKSLFDEHGGFDETFKIVGDYDLILRELPTRNAKFVPDVVTVGFQHGGVTNSPRAMAALLAELARVRKKHGIGTSALLPPSKTYLKMLLCAGIFRVAGDGGFRRLADASRLLRGRPPAWR